MASSAGRDVQVEARALGDPTRYRIFRYVAEAGEPVGVAELTATTRLNHNAVRQHLARLRDAGLIVEQRENRDRPGRPRLLYRLHPEAVGSWGTAGPYAWLAGLLSEAVRRRLGAREAGRQEGLRRGDELDGPTDPIERLEAEIVRCGFRPERSERGRRIEFVLGRCPFADVASRDPETICRLHLGLAEGFAERWGGFDVKRLVVKDAHRAGCRLVVQRSPARTPVTSTPE